MSVEQKAAEVSVTNVFPKFAKLVHQSFQELAAAPIVFETGSGDTLWEAYLNAFPPGTNPLFKKRTEHDCSCCRQFIRRAGMITDGKGQTVWDEAAKSAPEPYRQVAKALRDLVRSMPISNIYMISKKEGAFGTRESHSQAEGGPVITWNHFYTGEIPSKLRSDSADATKGEFRTSVEVFARGVKELKPDAVESVLGLIEANNLYRGEEHKAAVLAFQKAQKEYNAAKDKEAFVWLNCTKAFRFRNTVIGTLVTDISDGMDIEAAVRAFETKVAPQNYKRTTAVITPGMIKKAMETITELGLEPALERRFAKIGDINVNDVLWVDNSVKNLMKGGLEAALLKEAKVTAPSEQKAESIGMAEFLGLLKGTTSLELFLDGAHLGNMVSLTAPVHPEPKQLFKWSNDFSWSYTGNVADSIKERVKKAGGKVTGVMRVSLSWFNYDDLDLHIYESGGRGVRVLGDHIYFGHKQGASGGCLDVDMNAGGGRTREPVENVAWSNKPPDGSYKVVVNNYSHRESKDVGFVIEIESAGKLHNFSYNKGVRQAQDIHVCTLQVKGGVITSIEEGDAGITSSALSQDKWGLKSESWVKVNAVTLSPNYWGDNKVGNKHVFFFLEGCQSDEATRGIYNEFLHSRLEPHRKVFEVIGEKTKCQPTPGQLSGLGFSSTKKETVLVKVNGKRLYKVQTGD